MELGAFSISLAVKDCNVSKEFYENLGFSAIDGAYKNSDFPMKEGQDWIIMKLGTTIIGLFQGMFDANILTFGPPDVRSVQRKLKKKGITFVLEADESAEGPAHAALQDPDGNQILLDQHEK